MIAHGWRRDGEFQFAVLGEEIDRFFADFRIERSFFLESGKQFAHGARIKQRPGKAVLPDFAGLLQHVDIFFAELGVRIRCIVFVD